MDLCAIFLLFLFNIIFTLSFFLIFHVIVVAIVIIDAFVADIIVFVILLIARSRLPFFVAIVAIIETVDPKYIYIVHTDIVVIVFFYYSVYNFFCIIFFVDFLRFSSPFSRSVFQFVFSIHFKLGSYCYTIYVYTTIGSQCIIPLC